MPVRLYIPRAVYGDSCFVDVNEDIKAAKFTYGFSEKIINMSDEKINIQRLGNDPPGAL